MLLFVLSPFIAQGIAMFWDEFYYHHKRRLGLWETFGHPLDSLTVIGCLSVPAMLPMNQGNVILFVCLAVFSCLFITKDEFIHNKQCDSGEQWIHAVLFVLHPLMFLSACYLWFMSTVGQKFSPSFDVALNSESLFQQMTLPLNIIRGQLISVCLFAVYQFTYWGYHAKFSKQ